MAVLELINKRGGGVFDEHEEIALLRLCGAVECLLRRKAAEVLLMKSGMTLRSCFKNGRGGDTASSNSARVESTILRLYSETNPSDLLFGDRDRARGSKNAPSTAGGGDAGSRDAATATGEGADGSKNHWDPVGERLRRASMGNDERSWCTKAADSVIRLQDSSRLLGAADSENNSELVDWSLNMFERTAAQQLSMVERFFQSMGLAERFQVSGRVQFVSLCCACVYPCVKQLYAICACHMGRCLTALSCVFEHGVAVAYLLLAAITRRCSSLSRYRP